MPDDQPPFRSPARRRGERRINADRREMIRFEPEKNPRRSGKDQRKSKDLWLGRDKF